VGFVGALFRAFGLVQVGRASEGVPLAEGLWGMLTATGAHTAELASLVANVLAIGGNRRDALAVAEAGLARARRHGPHYLESDLLRLQGELRLDLESGDESQAIASLERAQRIARRQGALLLELRAAVPLARSRSRAGRPRDGVDLLRACCDRFPSGSEVTDLRRAMQALEALLDPSS
jgi:predicted ATPase